MAPCRLQALRAECITRAVIWGENTALTAHGCINGAYVNRCALSAMVLKKMSWCINGLPFALICINDLLGSDALY